MADVAVEMVIVGKIILSILLVAGGLYAIHAGQRLFRDGIGLKPGKSELTIFKQIKLTTTSIGGTLMVTAAAWGCLGSHSLPTYSRDGDKLDIAKLEVRPGKVITFAPNQFKLTPEQIASLAKLVSEKHSNWVLTVEGTATPNDTNLDLPELLSLAQARADSVKSALIKAGISENDFRKITSAIVPSDTPGAAQVSVIDNGQQS